MENVSESLIEDLIVLGEERNISGTVIGADVRLLAGDKSYFMNVKTREGFLAESLLNHMDSIDSLNRGPDLVIDGVEFDIKQPFVLNEPEVTTEVLKYHLVGKFVCYVVHSAWLEEDPADE